MHCWARAYIPCQRAKVHRHTMTSFEKFAPPDVLFDPVRINIVGPLPPCQYEHAYSLTSRQIHALGRGPRLPAPLGCSFRCAIHNNNGSWKAVRIITICQHYTFYWSFLHSNNRLPPDKQRHSEVFLLPARVCARRNKRAHLVGGTATHS